MNELEEIRKLDQMAADIALGENKKLSAEDGVCRKSVISGTRKEIS